MKEKPARGSKEIPAGAVAYRPRFPIVAPKPPYTLMEPRYRGMASTRWVWAFVLLLPSVNAEPIRADFSTEGIADFEGVTHGGELASLYYVDEVIPGFVPPSSSDMAYSLTTLDGIVEHVRYQTAHVRRPGGWFTGQSNYLGRDTLWLSNQGPLSLKVELPGPDDNEVSYQYYMPIGGTPRSWTVPVSSARVGEAVWNVGIHFIPPHGPLSAYSANFPILSSSPDPEYEVFSYRAPGFRASYSTLPTLELPGDWRGYLFGANVSVIGSGGEIQLATGRFVNESSTFDPVTESGLLVLDWMFARVTATAPSITIDSGPATWSFGWTAINGTIDGLSTWRGVHGALNNSTAAPVTLDGDTLESNGPLAFSAGPSQSEDGRYQTHWQLKGDSRFLATNGRPLWGTREEGALGVVGTSLALVLLGWLGKGLLTAILGRHTPTLLQEDALRSLTRRRILRVLQEQQAITSPNLARQLGLSDTAIRYQLRVLMALGLITRASSTGQRELKRNIPYVLNSGSLEFEATTGRKASSLLASIHSHPLRHWLYNRISAQPDSGYVDLVTEARRQGITFRRSAASHHLIELERTGAIASSRTRDGKRYRAILDVHAVRQQQYRRYLAALGCPNLGELLNRQGNLKRLERKQLRYLADVGLLESSPTGFIPIPPVHAAVQAGVLA